MFHLQTYIYFTVYNPSFPGNIPVDDTDTLRKAEPYLNFERLEGHIELSYHGQPILTEKYGDFIVEYWAYVLDLIQGFAEKGKARMYLPDQPIPIDIEDKGSNWVLMTIGSKGKYGKWLLPKEELMKTLIDGAVRFFKGLYESFSDSINQKYRFNDLYLGVLEMKNQYFGE